MSNIDDALTTLEKCHTFGWTLPQGFEAGMLPLLVAVARAAECTGKGLCGLNSAPPTSRLDCDVCLALAAVERYATENLPNEGFAKDGFEI